MLILKCICALALMVMCGMIGSVIRQYIDEKKFWEEYSRK